MEHFAGNHPGSERDEQISAPNKERRMIWWQFLDLPECGGTGRGDLG